MGTFNIAIDVDVDGKKQEFAFKWTADAEQIRHLVDCIENRRFALMSLQKR